MLKSVWPLLGVTFSKFLEEVKCNNANNWIRFYPLYWK